MNEIKLTCSRPIYFGIAIWGQDFLQKFMDNCLASLLSSGNIPALPNADKKNKFIFCTTAEDWEWLKSQPIFLLLSQYLTTEFMPIKMISEKEYQHHDELAYKFHIVTQAHSDLVSRMYQDKAIGSLIFPDTIYSSNSLKSVFSQILKQNVKAILAHVPRLSTPVLLKKLSEHGFIKQNQPVEITSRTLARHALTHMNTEVLAQNWDALYAFDFITDVWRPLQKNHPEEGIAAHSFAWCPIFLDYGKLSSHNIKCLENNTIDGSYLYSNFKFEDLYLVTDSDEFLMISYSPHTKLRIKEKIMHENPLINHFKKITHWRHMIQASLGGFGDPLKLQLLKVPVFMHVHDLKRRDCQIRKQTLKVVNKILDKPRWLERFTETETFYSNKWIKRMIAITKYKAAEEGISVDNLIREHTI